jgi:hypothetical protein
MFQDMIERAKELNRCENYLAVEIMVVKWRGDCTNNGVTARFDTLYVPCETGNYTKTELVKLGREQQMLGVKPPAFPGCPYRFTVLGGGMAMAGGNYVVGDSRFMDEYGGPISVHDRIE